MAEVEESVCRHCTKPIEFWGIRLKDRKWWHVGGPRECTALKAEPIEKNAIPAKWQLVYDQCVEFLENPGAPSAVAIGWCKSILEEYGQVLAAQREQNENEKSRHDSIAGMRKQKVEE